MIDIVKLKPVLEGYKAHFPSRWIIKNGERFKWEAVEHFQDHWKIDAPNFGEMFKKATGKTSSLLDSGYVFPRRMILEFAKADDDFVRQMFLELSDESHDLAERVEAFQAAAEDIRAKYDDGNWHNHYQNLSVISTYLWLLYPDKYYIYRYTVFRDVATELNSDWRPKRNGAVSNLIDGYRFYDELCKAISEDASVTDLLNRSITDSCYKDTQYRTLTMDIGFYLSSIFLKE